MRSRSVAFSRVINLVALAASAVLSGLPAFAMETHRFDIPEESASAAIRDFGTQAHVQVLVAGEYVKSKKFHAVSGNLSTEQALDRMLEGSGLTHKYVGDGSIALVPMSQPGDPSSTQGSAQPGRPGKGGQDSFGSFLLAQAAQGQASSAASVTSDSSISENETPHLQEVIVTAQKRAERLQDVPESITVLDTQSLAENGQVRLIDYFSSVPGLTISAGGNGNTYIVIRGLSAGANQNPMVATVVDDVPAIASTSNGKGQSTSPDLDPSDLARIEVLKGPQGTLYGADSLGGLIKYVTIDPSMTGWSGRAEVGGEDIPAGGLGYSVRGAVNVPISDVFALRVSAFDRRDPGYIDDLSTGQSNFNSSDIYGSHVAALWRPSDSFSVKFGALIQQTHGNDSVFDSTISGRSAYGDLGLTALPGSTSYSNQFQLYSANVSWRVRGVDFTSITGYVVNSSVNAMDWTTSQGAAEYECYHEPAPCTLSPTGPRGIIGATSISSADTRKFSQELRLGSSIGYWLDWRLGGFYTHEETPTDSNIFYGNDLSTGATLFTNFANTWTGPEFNESAVFGDLTAHLTDRFDLEAGVRQSWNNQKLYSTYTGLAVYAFTGSLPPVVSPVERATGEAFTYQVTPKFKISRDVMVYARIATGYRIGGFNGDAYVLSYEGLGIPAEFAPDKTNNYEIGIKADLIKDTLTFDVAAFHVDWSDFQANVVRPYAIPGGQAYVLYTVNGGQAKSDGLELSLQSHPFEGFTLAAQGSYNDAVLTQALPSGSTAYGPKGTQLPYSAKYSGGLAAREDIPLTREWIGFVGTSVNYLDARPQEFTGSATQPRIVYPGYTQLNFNLGARHDSWLTTLYINNAANVRGVVGIAHWYSLSSPYGYTATVVQPRTVGLSVEKTF